MSIHRIAPRAALVLLALLLAAGLSSAAGPEYAIPRWTVDAGGGRLEGGDYVLTGTAGQHDAGARLEGGDYALTGGFWAGSAAQPTPTPGPTDHPVYLPLILRNAP